ncbi:MAG: glycosyltransferase [Phycisphaerales bacterium]|nr:MAG: glycosyltransferase [Phycisphaerales bacterium]
MANDNLPLVSVVIPTRNEAHFIEDALTKILENDYPSDLIEILVVDGGSNDGTIDIVKSMAAEHPNIRLLGGPGVNCPAGMNIGIQNSKGEIVCKVDAHGYIDRRFIKLGVDHIRSDKDIKCAGGPIRAMPKGLVEESSVLARCSVFGVGGGINTIGEEPQFVDTVQCGIYEKKVFDAVGLFDESMQFGEDEEINWRIIKAGYKIYCTPEIKFHYYPRKSFRAFYRQYFNYGRARVKVCRKHRNFLRIKHVIPSAFVLSLLASAILAFFVHDLFIWVFVAIVGLYLLASLFVSASISARSGWRYFAALPISFACLHFGYGLGFLRGILDLVMPKRKAAR